MGLFVVVEWVKSQETSESDKIPNGGDTKLGQHFEEGVISDIK